MSECLLIFADVCVYKGNYYTQGQQWYDGCDYVCNCEDAMEGLYTCNERLVQFFLVVSLIWKIVELSLDTDVN